MAAGTARPRQDMPPKGGYGPIDYSRKLFSRVKGKHIFVPFLGLTGYCWWLFAETRRYNRMHQLENTEANIALEPLLIAENDRLSLKLFRQNCELEEDLMKDNPDWQLGTLYGEPVFHDTRNRGLMPYGYELWAHTNSITGQQITTDYFERAQGAFLEQITRRNPQPVPEKKDN